MDKEKGSDPFHDSEEGDVYDLYNACDGAVLASDRLDVSKLDELSAEEREALDVDRLREVWEHTKGCPICEHIVRTLNLTRRILRSERPAPPETGHKR